MLKVFEHASFVDAHEHLDVGQIHLSMPGYTKCSSFLKKHMQDKVVLIYSGIFLQRQQHAWTYTDLTPSRCLQTYAYMYLTHMPEQRFAQNTDEKRQMYVNSAVGTIKHF